MQRKSKQNSDLAELLPDALSGIRKNIIEPIFGSDSNRLKAGKPPFRAEILTDEQLVVFAEELANRHDLMTGTADEQLLRRLADNENTLLKVHAELTQEARNGNRIVPAAEWLLDNFYLIEENIFTGKQHLPKGYSLALPKLLRGYSAGLPRIYDTSVEIISHSDGHLSESMLNHFISSYQSVNDLQLGELWAIPIMLRLALIENLRRLALQISGDIQSKSIANYWADQLQAKTEKKPQELILTIADMARANPPMNSAFVAELTRRLQEKGSIFTLALNWLDQRLKEEGHDKFVFIQQDNQKQAADQISMSNSIGSLRFLGKTDWQSFVERNSIVEKVLSADVHYNKMNFATRDMYRHAVERIATHSVCSEKEVAIIAMQEADQCEDVPGEIAQKHVGYYLIGAGVTQVEKIAQYKYSFAERCKKIANKYPTQFYIGAVVLITALICRWLYVDYGLLLPYPWQRIFFVIFSALAFSQLSLGIINWLITVTAKPRLMPRMNFSKGVPDECRTLVVVPTLIGNIATISELTESLEVRFLANRDRNIYFGLLADFKDADQEVLPHDNALLQFTIDKINALNKKYSENEHAPFMLFFRPRLWNPSEKKWMAYERKRGKLAALNALLQGNGRENFIRIMGEEEIYQSCKYVITLDADTQLPIDSAWKLIGTMDHPLNKPIYSEKKRRVVAGYSILQPRVSNSLPPNGSSWFALIHGNEPGTDPYTRVTSDVYQDIFSEGSFIGKGIYDVAMFSRALQERLPENRILSHDLLEGAYARAGLTTDIQLYEDYPESYLTDMARRHRWVRGDWQIAAWLLPFVPGKKKKLTYNPISFLSAWKIFDNLRRSLVPFSLLALLLSGWTFLNAPVLFTAFVIGILIIPGCLNFVWQLFHKPRDSSYIQQLVFCSRAFKDNLIQQALSLITLPYEAYVNLHAILTSLIRIFITRKHLLQWMPYNGQIKNDIRTTFLKMWVSPVLGMLCLLLLSLYYPASMAVSIPILIGWMLSPAVVWMFSQSREYKRSTINEKQIQYLRKLNRKIWAFFEDFVTEEDNFLPPDNYQIEPVERIAHRTSPTNIGIYLLSSLSAWDFGYINTEALLQRIENSFQSISKLEKYKGHLLNWYDTRTLAPLHPRYISTVDSGNFIGNLITLKEGLHQLANQKVISNTAFEGLWDSLSVFVEKTETDTAQIKTLMDEIETHLASDETDILLMKSFADMLYEKYKSIISETDTEIENPFAKKVLEQIVHIKTDFLNYFPWLFLPETPEKFKHLVPNLPAAPSFLQLTKIEESLLHKIVDSYQDDNTTEENEWLNNFRTGLNSSSRYSKETLLRVQRIVNFCMENTRVEYHFLYNPVQRLLSIGYNLDEHRVDQSYYDLLASEARLSNFIAIAQGQLSQQSWFALGRQLTSYNNSAILLSWSGSVFEYLMPLLIMPNYDNTLLNQTYEALVKKQIDYGRMRSVPWGISESGYNMIDAHLNYQYRAFGVPGIGLKRGLGDDLVIAPYATVMSLMVAPQESYQNLIAMQEEGFAGEYGFYEAIDYTQSRLSRKQDYKVIRSFMAHHQGMSMLSLNYLLKEERMTKRFASDTQVKSALLLLQERIPRANNFYSPSVHEMDVSINPASNASIRVIHTAHTEIPDIQLISNGRYHIMVTNAGGGYSRWNHLAITRWREDTTRDNYGNFCYIKDVDTGIFWSNAYQPLLETGSNYEAVFSEGRAEFRRTDNKLDTHTEIVISPEDDIELRRIHLTNRSRKKRCIEITSYAEVVLAPAAADESHPAFSNLFIQTEWIKHRHALLCTRRSRSAEEHNPCMFHLMKVNHAQVETISYETSREKFIGRTRSVHLPDAMIDSDELSNSSGSVLDPIVAIRYRIYIEPNETVVADLIYGVADTTENAQILIDKYQDKSFANRCLELSWTHSQIILRQINAIESEAQLFNRLAGSILYANNGMRTDASNIIKNSRTQSALWSYAISGDLPIVLLQIEDSENINLIRQILQAHAYWRLKGLIVDLVILNDNHGGYRQELNDQIQALAAVGMHSELRDKPGGIFIRSADQIPNEDRILFQSVAHIVLSDKPGNLEDQINRSIRLNTEMPQFNPSKFFPSYESILKQPLAMPESLEFYNGMGGFSASGKEYIIQTHANRPTPAPWINSLSNENFGSIISESGQSYTWVANAHELRLTPWNNDPVGDLNGEAFYIRDEESGLFWSPFALPSPGKGIYLTRHGFGYSIFESSNDGIACTATVFVDEKDPVKYILIKLKNYSGRERKLSITGYMSWVLGVYRTRAQMHSISEYHPETGALLARNMYNSEFQSRVAFFVLDEKEKTFTCDRTEFLGRNGTASNPDAMNRTRLSGKTGAGLDPCAAIQSAVELPDDTEKEFCFCMGAGESIPHAIELIQKCKSAKYAAEAFEKTKAYWENKLTTLQIETPDKATNFLANGWLNYQSIACRMMGRSGFYQSGGAFGFRDQLQDVLSVMVSEPEMARAHIVLSASRQFLEGDVQHWWHPPTGRGVRTTCSDDYLWLPFVMAQFCSSTGDYAILQESIGFLEGRMLNIGEDSYYDLPIISDQRASLYEHGKRAIRYGLKFGEHGLPLMGSGDWNDGMDKVGEAGKGESIWLGFFLYEVLQTFIPLAESEKDEAFSKECIEQAKRLKENIHAHGWDGEWYRRAYFDDGTPLGSSENEECKIDSIAQSWSVLSGAGDPGRCETAMQSAQHYLVKKDPGIIQLFNPPFDNSELNPGYIKGYVPGVRENGGQYTHAAIWLVMALAALKKKEEAWDLLQMINPINKSSSPEKISQYKVEPYVIAADVYAVAGNEGRGGWTWYTGSAGWMYQLILFYIIGFRKKGNRLSFDPCIPESWNSFSIHYRFGNTTYHIELKKSTHTEKPLIEIDGEKTENDFIELEDTGGMRKAVVNY